MNRHASMNRIYRLVWSHVSSAWIPVAETAKGRGKSGRARTTSIASRNLLSAAISLALGSAAHAAPPAPTCVAPTCGTGVISVTSHPVGAQVISGTASITQSGTSTDVRQVSPDVSADGSAITLKDAGALTAVLDSSGASTLTSLGAMTVSGTVGTTLKTTTTGTDAATTFGATTVVSR
jgi:hypothetical protein